MITYFDNAAAVPVSPRIRNRFLELGENLFANQESAGAHGVCAAKALKEMEQQILSLFPSSVPHRVFPLFSGTAAVSAGIRAAASHFPRGGVVLTTEADHACVRAALHDLPDPFRCLTVPLQPDGTIVPDRFEKMVRENPVVLVCLSAVQPETGAVQKTSDLRKILRSAAPDALFFCDTIQAAGKLPVDTEADLFPVSGQKLGCPAGAFLIVRSDLFPAVQAMRQTHHAVDRVPPAFQLLLAECLKDRIMQMERNLAWIRDTKQRMISLLEQRIPGRFRLTLPDGKGSPYLLHLLLEHGVQGAIAVRAMAEKGYSLSSGSACDAETRHPSRVLTAMGIGRKDAYSALRISFFEPVPDEDMQAFVSALKDVLDNY